MSFMKRPLMTLHIYLIGFTGEELSYFKELNKSLVAMNDFSMSYGPSLLETWINSVSLKLDLGKTENKPTHIEMRWLSSSTRTEKGVFGGSVLLMLLALLLCLNEGW